MKRFDFRPLDSVGRGVFFIVAIAVFLMFATTACEEYEMKSLPLDRTITVDGDAHDWIGHFYFVEQDNLSIGIAHDESFLYICLDVGNPFHRMNIMGQGLTLWFDPQGGKSKAFGIRFPTPFEWDEKERKAMPPPEEGRPQWDFQEMMKKRLAELDILWEGGDRKERVAVDEMKGLQVRLGGLEDWRLVYEARIPLAASSEMPYAIGTVFGKTIGVGLEISRMKGMMGRRPGGMAGPPPGGGIGGPPPGGGIGGPPPGGGRGGMGPGGGMPGGMRSNMSGQLKAWIKVTLVSSPEK